MVASNHRIESDMNDLFAGEHRAESPRSVARSCSLAASFADLSLSMSTVVIALLIGLSAYLGARLHASATEISDLRKNIVMLKRRLGQT